MSEEIKKALTVKTGQKTSYDIYLEENGNSRGYRKL